MRPQLPIAPKRAAFTIVELLVSISIIGLLCALLLPAVQMVRESARRASCRNNLHQMGVAMENRAATVGHFPDAMIVFRELLPELEQAALYQNIITDVYASSSPAKPSFATFRCPSDSTAPVPDVLCYAANVGTGNQTDGLNGFFTTTTDGFPVGTPQVNAASLSLTTHRDITDGLSQTIAIAEMLPSTWEISAPPVSDFRRVYWATFPPLVRPSEFRQFVDQCAAIRDSQAGANQVGAPRGWGWTSAVTNYAMALYHHVLPPNMPSCFNGGHTYGVFAAGSLHVGGVHALYGDGHVEFISNSIDQKVWHDLGTRAGQ